MQILNIAIFLGFAVIVSQVFASTYLATLPCGLMVLQGGRLCVLSAFTLCLFFIKNRLFSHILNPDHSFPSL